MGELMQEPWPLLNSAAGIITVIRLVPLQLTDCLCLDAYVSACFSHL